MVCLGPQKLNLGILTPKGLNLGIDFQGGLIHQVTIYSGMDQETVRKYAVESGLGNEVQNIIIPEKSRIGNATSFLIKTIITKDEDEFIRSNPEMTPSKFLNERTKKFYDLLKRHESAMNYTIIVYSGVTVDALKQIASSNNISLKINPIGVSDAEKIGKATKYALRLALTDEEKDALTKSSSGIPESVTKRMTLFMDQVRKQADAEYILEKDELAKVKEKKLRQFPGKKMPYHQRTRLFLIISLL